MMDVSAILEAVSRLIWPILVAVVLWKLYPSVRTIIENRGFTIKVGDMEITVQEASDQLRAQVEDLQKVVSDLRLQMQQRAEPEARPYVAAPPAEKPIRRLLWVDDNPENNAYEIASLRDRVEVRQATSTDDALRMLLSGRFDADAVVSDMGRDEPGGFQPTAGLTLARALREAGIEVPIFFYTSHQSFERYREEVMASGGNGITASPVDLLGMINR